MNNEQQHKGWIGVDLDGTLAHYDGWKGIGHIGTPIPKMLERVKQWLAEGKDVRIFTARISRTGLDGELARQRIQQWCVAHIGHLMPITCAKDFGMIELWDDRAVQVVPNTGETIEKVACENWRVRDQRLQNHIVELERELTALRG